MPVASVRFDREAKQCTRIEQRGSLRHDRCEIAHIRQNIQREDEVIARRRSASSAAMNAPISADLQTIVETFLARLRDHRR